MPAPIPPPPTQPTNYLLVGSLTLAIYLMTLWMARYLPEELAYIRSLVHGLLLMALVILWAGYRQYRRKNQPPPLLRKRPPPSPRRPSP